MPKKRLFISLIPVRKSSSRFQKKVLNNVEQWLASNRLVLNQRKTRLMLLFGTRQKLEHCSDRRIQLQGKEIERAIKS